MVGRSIGRSPARAPLRILRHLDRRAPDQIVEVGAVGDQEAGLGLVRPLLPSSARPVAPRAAPRPRRGAATSPSATTACAFPRRARANAASRSLRPWISSTCICRPSRCAPASVSRSTSTESTTSIGSMTIGDPGQRRQRLLQQLETLGGQLGEGERQAGDVAAGPRQARAQPSRDRIAARQGDDRDRLRCLARRLARRLAAGEDHVHLETHQLFGHRRQPIGAAVGVAALDDDVPALDVAGLAQAFCESPPRSGRGRRGRRCERTTARRCAARPAGAWAAAGRARRRRPRPAREHAARRDAAAGATPRRRRAARIAFIAPAPLRQEALDRFEELLQVDRLGDEGVEPRA